MSVQKFLLCIVLITNSVFAASRPAISFSCVVPDNLPQWAEVMEVYTNAFDNIGFDFSMVYVDPKHEIEDLINLHSYDGICGRVHNFSDELRIESIVRLNTAVMKTVLSVYRHPAMSTETPNVLFFPGAKVGYLNSILVHKSILADHDEVIAVSFLKPEMGIKSLAEGEIDYWVGVSVVGEYMIKQLKVESSVTKIVNLKSDALYPYLNIKHSNIVTPLEVELQKIIEQRGSLIE